MGFFKKNIKKFELNIFYRYIFLFVLSFILLSSIFTTIFIEIFNKIIYFLFSFFISINIENSIIHISNSYFQIIPECIATHAYLLIAFFIFSYPFKFKASILIFLKSAFYFSIFNIIRIIFLFLIQIYFGQYYFNLFHLVFYEFLSAVISSFIVLYEIKSNRKSLFIKSNKNERILPLITDIKRLVK